MSRQSNFGHVTISIELDKLFFSIMELTSNMSYFLTHWTYMANATNGILSGIMPTVSCFQFNGTVTSEIDIQRS